MCAHGGNGNHLFHNVWKNYFSGCSQGSQTDKYSGSKSDRNISRREGSWNLSNVWNGREYRGGIFNSLNITLPSSFIYDWKLMLDSSPTISEKSLKENYWRKGSLIIVIISYWFQLTITIVYCHQCPYLKIICFVFLRKDIFKSLKMKSKWNKN